MLKTGAKLNANVRNAKGLKGEGKHAATSR